MQIKPTDIVSEVACECGNPKCQCTTLMLSTFFVRYRVKNQRVIADACTTPPTGLKLVFKGKNYRVYERDI